MVATRSAAKALLSATDRDVQNEHRPQNSPTKHDVISSQAPIEEKQDAIDNEKQADTIDLIQKDCSPSKTFVEDRQSIKAKVTKPRPPTLEELEREIFNGSDSSDDEDFSFSKARKTTKCDALFVIDRAADRPAAPSVDESLPSPAGKKQLAEQKKRLRKELSKAPIQLAVPVVTVQDKEVESVHDKIMKKSVIDEGFEKRHSVPPYSEGKKAMARKRREEKATTKSEWFGMKAPEMTDELQADLEAMQMRGSISSWTGYKKNDYKNGPKFFQVGTVVDSPLDFYHSRIPKKDRKRTIVDELLADADFRKNNKKMYMKAAEKLNKRHPNKKGGRHKPKVR